MRLLAALRGVVQFALLPLQRLLFGVPEPRQASRPAILDQNGPTVAEMVAALKRTNGRP